MTYRAFVVGVNALGLQYCENDALLVGSALEARGYQVTRPARQEIQDELLALLDECKTTDTVILYFSGHGWMDRRKLWLVTGENPGLLRERFDLNTAMDYFSGCEAVNKLVILDCCYAAEAARDLRIDIPDRFLLLTSSPANKKSFEFEDFKASFLAHHLQAALIHPDLQLLDTKNNLSVLALGRWLKEKAQLHNSTPGALQVSLPDLFGPQNIDFSLCTAPVESGSLTRQTPEIVVEQRYREFLLRTCDILSLANLPEQDRHLAQRQLELRRLYIPLRAHVESESGRDLTEKDYLKIEKRRNARLRSTGDRKSEAGVERVTLGERLAEARRLVILGDPGSGKTTFTRWIITAYLMRLKHDSGWQQIPDVQSLPEEDWLPVLVRCRDLGEDYRGGALDEMLFILLRNAHFSREDCDILCRSLVGRLNDGKVLLIFDGLDEIADPGARMRFCEQLERIHLAFPLAPIIATSRIVGYREMGYRLGHGFEHLTLLDLNREEKDHFVTRWCALTELPERAERVARELIHDIHSTDRIERMTGNPMLLTTMALVKRKVGKLPNRRTELYWEAVQVLLNWRSEVDKPLDWQEALPQLEYLAHAMCDQEVQRMHQEEILRLFAQLRVNYPNLYKVLQHSPDEFLQLLEARTGIINAVGYTHHLGRILPVYEFRHLTFQEYLAARALIDGRFAGYQIGKPLAEYIAPLAGRTSHKPGVPDEEAGVVESWREALRLCVTTCDDRDADSVLKAIALPGPDESTPIQRSRAILGLLCLADEPNVSDQTARTVCQAFAAQLNGADSESTSGPLLAAREAAASGKGYILLKSLVAEFCRRDYSNRTVVGEMYGELTIGLVRKKRREWLARQVQVLDNSSEETVVEATLGIIAIAQDGRLRLDLPLVRSLFVLLERSGAVRHVAAWALGKMNEFGRWSPSAEQVQPLVDCLNDPHSDPETLYWLCQVAGRVEMAPAVGALARCMRVVYPKTQQAAAQALAYIGDETTVDFFLTLLEDPEKDFRITAVERLGEINNQRALPHLIARLDDSDEDVCSTAMQVLERIAGESAVDSLVTLLKDPKDDVRLRAMQVLGQIHSERSVDPLVALLDDPWENVRSKAAWALSRVGSERALDGLIRRLQDPEQSVRGNAVIALGCIGSERALDGLIARLEDPVEDVRRYTIVALGRIGSQRAVEPLLTCFPYLTVDERRSVIMALHFIGGEGVIEPLISCLEDPADEVRDYAAAALGYTGSELAIDPLISSLLDPQPELRGSAVTALGRIANERAVDALINCLDDPDPALSRNAAWALGRLGSQRAIEPLLGMLKHPDLNTRAWVVAALGTIRSDRAVDDLIAMLDDPVPEVCGNAAWALGNIRSERAIEPLIAHLQVTDDYRSIRLSGQAAEALGRIGSEGLIDTLLTCLDSPQEGVGRAAGMALGFIGTDRAIDPLLERLSHPDINVRIMAAQAMARCHNERAVEPLIACLVDPDDTVRNSAAEALGCIGSERALEPLFTRLENPDPQFDIDALFCLSRTLEYIDQCLLSWDLYGSEPYLDPLSPISMEQVVKASDRFWVPIYKVKQRYEKLAGRFHLKLQWTGQPLS